MASKQVGKAPTSANDAARLVDLKGSFRNRIRNGTLGVNQRGVSGTVTLAAGAYGHDGFKGGASGGTYTFATSGAVTTLTITANTILQVLEGVMYVPEGGTYTLSWTGTAKARVYQGTATGAYASSPITVTGLTAGANTTIEWNAGTLSLPQFEPGTAATAFEFRDDELSRNQRYFYAIYKNDLLFRAYNQGSSSQSVSFPYILPIPMRAVPAITNPTCDVNDGAETTLSTAFASTSSTVVLIQSNVPVAGYVDLHGFMASAEL